MAMTTVCKDKDGAWQFMREILSENTSSGPGYRFWGLPINKTMFDRLFEEAMTQEYYTDDDGNEVPVPRMGYFTETGATINIGLENIYYHISPGSSAQEVSSYFDEPQDEIAYIYAMTREDVDQVLEVLDNVYSAGGMYDDRMMNIIYEGAESYFNGTATAQDAARVIQSRASVYIAEQS
jgi:hypothetical protein